MSRRRKPKVVLPTPTVVTTTPMPGQVNFRIIQGARLEYQGQALRVVGFSGDGSPENPLKVSLRDDEHLPLEVHLTDLVTDPTFRPLDAGLEKLPAIAAYHAHWSKLDDTVKLAALEREGHLLEVLTGYKSGRPEEDRPSEPRPAYQAEKQGDRVAAKAAELGVSPRQVNRWLHDYRAKGQHPVALIDLNAFRLSSRLGRQEAVIGDAILTVAKARENATDVTFTELREQVDDLLAGWLKKGRMKEAVTLPSQPTFNDLVRRLAPELARNAKQRRSEKSRDQGRRFYKLVSTRAGQYVLIDVTPFDLVARSEVDGSEVRLRLVLALDHYTRAIVAAEFLEYEPRGVDLASFLLDIIFPLRAPPSWPALPEDARLPYAGLPEAILLAAHEMPEGSPLVNLPPIMPEAVVVDNGKAFLSREFLDMCARLEIDVLFARPGTGSDKSQIERAFRTFREGLAQKLEGYVGPHVLARGRQVKGFHFAWEVRYHAVQWFARYYNHVTHGGLFHPAMPKVKLTPSQMYAVSLAHAGYLAVPLGKDTYYLALRTELRKIGDVGIRSDGYQYDSDVLNPYRNQRSPYAELGWKWPVKIDRRDPTTVYWQHPDTGEWHAIPARDADWRARPFQDEQVDRIKLILEERRFTTTNHEEMRDVQKEIRTEYHEQVRVTKRLTRQTEAQELTPGERAELARREQADAQRARNSEAGPVPASTPATGGVRRSPEWQRETTLSDDELMTEVGNDF